MLVQFESKSARVKGVSFHPRRPWLLASLHNGAVQLLDYRMSTLIDTYVEHEGPVRGIAFHPTQPLFVSGGDDYKIKVFNYQLRRCLFTLLGHLDYVRTVQFHHESPWIVSASDDQTVRIWNWQNRSCLAVLTGHNHYVMSACFHPLEDLVLSASLDQTVRVWDISGLSGSGTAAAAAAAAAAAGIPAAALAYGSGGGGGGVGMGGGSGFPGRGPFGARTSPGGANDLFGGASTDVAVKFVLEGHARGVNWAAFHPTMPLIVSGADDRQIKLWRYSETRAWEVDTLRGHLNNVSCVLFHPHLDLIVSDSEDRTIRVWDMARRACIATYRRDADRFWVLTVHPRLRILAAGHDSGAMVLKLQRERPAYAIAPDGRMVYTRERYVRVLDLNTGRDAPVCVARGRLPTGGGGGGSWPGSGAVEGGGVLGPPPRYLGYNPVEHAVLLQYDADGGTYELYVLPKGDDGGGAAVDAVEPRSGAASSAVFVGRNRFATLERNVLVVRDLHNAATKRVPVPLPGAERLFSAGAGYVFIASDERVALFDIQKRRVLAELNAPGIKYAVWSDDAHRVAFLAKHTLWLASRQLDRMASVHETVRIKSAAWDESGVLLYTTLNHLKYCLPNGDTGIVCTLAEPVYLTYARGPAVATIDRDGQPGSLAIDPTEYTFKLLLLRKRYDAVRRAIEEARMPGQAMISYLQRKGYPEIALLFVQDDQTRFALALDSGHLDEALSAAQRLDRAEVWEALAGKALAQGRVQMAELCYQKSKNLQRLAFLYVVTGELDKLEKLGQIAQSRQDSAAQLQIALLLGDTETPARVLRECGLTALAETAERVMETGATTLLPPEPVDDAMPGGDWPLLPQPRDLFERDPNAPEGDHAWDEERFRPTGEFYEAALGAHEATATEWEEDEQQQQQQQQQRQVGMVERGSAGSRSAPEVAPIAAAVAAMSVAEGGEESGWGDTLDALDVPLSPTVDTAPEAGSATEEAEEMTAAGEAWSEAAADEWTETAAAAAPARPTVGPAPELRWRRQARLAGELAAAGAFREALTLLHTQIGARCYQPLQWPLLQCAMAHRGALQLSPLPLLPPLLPSLRTGTATTPPAPLSLASLGQRARLAEACVTKGAFADAQRHWQAVVAALPLVVADSEDAAAQVRSLLGTAREYLLGMRVALEQKRCKAVAQEEAAAGAEATGRALQLAALFTHCNLQPVHMLLALRAAMKSAYEAKRLSLAAAFAHRIVDMAPEGDADTPSGAAAAAAAQKMLAYCDRNMALEVTEPPIDYDERRSFRIDARTLTPVYAGASTRLCPYCQAVYAEGGEEELICVLCGIAAVGASADGLRLMRAGSGGGSG